MIFPSTSDFTLIANQIIEEAFDLCGVSSEGEAINADQYARGLRSLNLLLQTWATSEHLWARTSKTITLVEGQAAYPIVPKAMRIIEARRKVSNIETPLMEWARETYSEQPAKLTKSIPTAFYYDPQQMDGTLYLWPTPSAATASTMTVEITYLRRINSVVGSGDQTDLPQEWLQAICYGLAAELALKYGVNPATLSKIEQRAAYLKAQLESFDTEPASMFLQPVNR